MIRKLVHAIVPERLRRRRSNEIISRIQVYCIFFALVGCAVYGSVWYLAGAEVLFGLAILIAFMLCCLLFAFRWVMKSRYITWGFILTLYLAYFTQIYYTGGPYSYVLANLFLLPFFGLLPGVRRNWYYFSGLTILTILGFFMASVTFGLQFPDEIPTKYDLIFNSVGTLFPYIAVTLLLPGFLKTVAKDNKALKDAYHQLKKTSKRLVESEKLASLGQLTAGIAHEINNPVNYTLGSAKHLKKDIEDLLEYENYRVELLRKLENSLASGELEDKVGVLKESLNENEKRKEEVQYDILLEELKALMDSVENGAERTAEIVKGLRTFSRLDDAEFKLINIEEYVESTLVLLQSKLKGRIEVKRLYNKLPPVECNPSKINQVLLNIISNAIQAIEGEGFIKIHLTYNVGLQQVTIKVEDSGKGIPRSIESEVFNPFFTTKEVGQGTGLGLAMCKGIIEEHGGRLFFRSLPGVGTTFFIELPLKSPKRHTEEQDSEKSANVSGDLLVE